VNEGSAATPALFVFSPTRSVAEFLSEHKSRSAAFASEELKNVSPGIWISQ